MIRVPYRRATLPQTMVEGNLFADFIDVAEQASRNGTDLDRYAIKRLTKRVPDRSLGWPQ